MSWFMIDDRFHAHPKISSLPNAAVGLWAKAGSWCAEFETDGVIPRQQVRALRGSAVQIQALVDAGLWTQSVNENGVIVFTFRDWGDYQQTREQRSNRRRIERESKARRRGCNADTETGRLDLSEREMNSNRNRNESESNANRNRNENEMNPNRSSDFPTTSENAEMSTPDATRMSTPRARRARPDPRPTNTNRGELKRENLPSESASAHAPAPSFDQGSAAADAPPPNTPTVTGDTPADWSTPDDPRCRQHAGLPRDQVPPCGACAQARRWFQDQKTHAKQARRAEIDACPWCDERGFVLVPTRGIDPDSPENRSVARKCDHRTPPEPVDLPPEYAQLRAARRNENAPNPPSLPPHTPENPSAGSRVWFGNSNAAKPPF